MKDGNDEECEAKKARTDDLVEDGRQPGTLDEAMEAEDAADDDAAAPKLGPVSSGTLLALLRQAIREEGVAKKSDFEAFETKFDARLKANEKAWKAKFGASEKRVQEFSNKADGSIGDLGAQMSKLGSRLEALAERSAGSNSSTSSPSSWAGRDAMSSHTIRG